MMGRGPNPRGAKIGKRLQEPLALPFLWEYEIAIPVMLHLAETFSFADTWPSTREIAEDEGMDRKTVNMILRRLEKFGLVKFRASAEGMGRRGAGWRLNRTPSKITMHDILRGCVDGSKVEGFYFAHLFAYAIRCRSGAS